MGTSASVIGKELGVSKNAVIGKSRRLTLPARPSPIPRDFRYRVFSHQVQQFKRVNNRNEDVGGLRRYGRSPFRKSRGDSHEQSERAVYCDHVGIIEVSEDPADAARSGREDLIHHDVGSNAQTIAFGGFNRNTDERSVKHH